LSAQIDATYSAPSCTPFSCPDQSMDVAATVVGHVAYYRLFWSAADQAASCEGAASSGTPCLNLRRMAHTCSKSSMGLPARARKLASYPSANLAIRRPGKIAAGVASHHILSNVRLSNTCNVPRCSTSASDVSAWSLPTT